MAFSNESPNQFWTNVVEVLTCPDDNDAGGGGGEARSPVYGFDNGFISSVRKESHVCNFGIVDEGSMQIFSAIFVRSVLIA